MQLTVSSTKETIDDKKLFKFGFALINASSQKIRILSDLACDIQTSRFNSDGIVYKMPEGHISLKEKERENV